MADFYQSKAGGSLLLAMSQDGVGSTEGLQLVHAREAGENASKCRPMVSEDNGKVIVRVGNPLHPMTEEDYVQWIYVQTSYGGVCCNLNPGDEPVVKLNMNPAEVESVYQYCTKDGLWKAPEPVLPVDFDQNTIACSAEFGCVDYSE